MTTGLDGLLTGITGRISQLDYNTMAKAALYFGTAAGIAMVSKIPFQGTTHNAMPLVSHAPNLIPIYAGIIQEKAREVKDGAEKAISATTSFISEKAKDLGELIVLSTASEEEKLTFAQRKSMIEEAPLYNRMIEVLSMSYKPTEVQMHYLNKSPDKKDHYKVTLASPGKGTVAAIVSFPKQMKPELPAIGNRQGSDKFMIPADGLEVISTQQSGPFYEKAVEFAQNMANEYDEPARLFVRDQTRPYPTFKMELLPHALPKMEKRDHMTYQQATRVLAARKAERQSQAYKQVA